MFKLRHWFNSIILPTATSYYNTTINNDEPKSEEHLYQKVLLHRPPASLQTSKTVRTAENQSLKLEISNGEQDPLQLAHI